MQLVQARRFFPNSDYGLMLFGDSRLMTFSFPGHC